MTRIDEMKKYGYTLIIYGLDGQIFGKWEHVGCFGIFHTGLWIIYDIDEKEIDRFILTDFKCYSIITKNKW